MAEQETFILSDGTGWSTYGTIWSFQTWTTTSAYSITDVALYGYKYGSCGDVKVSIREVDVATGKPTGADKCSVTVAEGVISNFPTRAWYTFTFDTSYALSDVTQYAIVIRATSGNAANYYAPFGYGSSGYADGGSGQGDGTTWGAVNTTNDMDFKIYGGTPSPGLPTIVSPAPTGVTDITLDETPLEWASGGDTDTYEIYFRESGDAWGEPVGVAQAGVEWTIDFGTLTYGTTYEWRIDATNVYDTTTGDTWSFTTISFDRILISYDLITGGSGAGPYDDPPGTEGTDWRWTGENNMLAVRRLVVAVEDKIWYEDL